MGRREALQEQYSNSLGDCNRKNAIAAVQNKAGGTAFGAALRAPSRPRPGFRSPWRAAAFLA
jgi:hypothetical protein